MLKHTPCCDKKTTSRHCKINLKPTYQPAHFWSLENWNSRSLKVYGPVDF